MNIQDFSDIFDKKDVYIKNNGGNNAISILIMSFFSGIVLSLMFHNLSIFFCEIISSLVVVLISMKIRQNLVRQFFVIKIITLTVLLLNYYGNITLYGRPYYRGGSDDYNFEEMGRLYIQNGYYWPWDYKYSSNGKGMYWLIALIMRMSSIVGEYHTVCFRVINMNLHIACGGLVYILFIMNGNPENAISKRLLIMYSLFPNALYLSSFVFRDTLVTFLLLVAVLLSNEIIGHSSKKDNTTLYRASCLILQVVLTSFSYWLRAELCIFILIAFIVSFLRNKGISGKPFLKILLVIIVVFVAFYYLGVIDYIISKVDRYRDYRVNGLTEDSNIIYQKIMSMSLIPFGIIGRALLGVLYPLPTDLLRIYTAFDSGIDFLKITVAIGSCWQIINLPFLFSEIKKKDKYVLLFIACFVSIVVTTFTFRHFIMIYPFMFIIIFRNKYNSSDNAKKQKKILGFLLLGFLGLMYIMVKML